MVVRGAINQVACLAIATMLWGLRVDQSFATSLVFALVIGNACWLLIDSGRAVVARWRHARRGGSADWPGWAWMAPIVVVGAVLGYAGGYTLSAALLGLPGGRSTLFGPVLLLSVVCALTVSYFFYARERLHDQQLEAAAAQRLASETQLKLLQSQLEPHMLFNTLANLRVLIGVDPARAQAMLDHLIGFLRGTLASTRVESHPLAAEFDALGDYVALMAVRMGPRLAVRFELPDALRAQPVPPLLLQPLVENAIRHGLEPAVRGGRLEVGAAQRDGRLRLRVRDTGVGLAAPGKPAAGAGGRFGVEQVRARLAALYGDGASFELRNADDAEGGTEALIEIPAARAA